MWVLENPQNQLQNWLTLAEALADAHAGQRLIRNYKLLRVMASAPTENQQYHQFSQRYKNFRISVYSYFLRLQIYTRSWLAVYNYHVGGLFSISQLDHTNPFVCYVASYCILAKGCMSTEYSYQCVPLSCLLCRQWLFLATQVWWQSYACHKAPIQEGGLSTQNTSQYKNLHVFLVSI